ncbi:SusC/RagA family TonB-linked outer membrane protein [Gynurincola endophyticus]|uniref:SusC/RagA family TonB-linked outer membrane protein n=1 Tax=Gynurincola endophyticus TaxID=2479004 RepID=UPI000F8D7114|nr:TonB-dependent receptor [Gynurincola endophyticus]
MRKKLSMLMLLVFSCGVLLAQKTISGKVTDETGIPIPNVSVVVKGLSIGTITKEDGTYSLSVPDNGRTLVFSGIDKQPVEVAIRDKATIDVVLKDQDSSLEEVVVVGYGVQSRKELTGNIVTVRGTAVADKPVQSFDAALAGRAAGVQITVPNGVLNNPPVFRIRGTNSINLSSQPLIVIDGMVTYTGDVSSTIAASNVLSNINPADIESMDILKDAAATAIYGSRAANGVVVITTKKGKKGRAKMTYDGWVGLTSPTRMWEMLNAQEYMTIKNEGTANLGIPDRYLPSYNADGSMVDTDWGDVIYRDGVSHNHGLSVSGANDMTSYFFSIGYTDQEGIVRGNDFNRKTVRFNADHKATSWLTFGLNASYANELNAATINTGSLPDAAFASAGAGRLALALPPNVSPYNPDGSYNLNGNAIGRGNNIENITFWNPQPILDKNYAHTTNNRVIGNFYLMAKPTRDITFRSSYGIDYLLTDNKNFYTALIGDGFANNGSAFSTLNKNQRWTWTNTLQYDKTFMDKHSVGLLIGSEQQKSTNEGFGLLRQGVSDAFYDVIQGGFTTPLATGLGLGENFLGSYFGRASYDYDKKYFVSGSYRRDGYSAFAPGLKWGNFYSISGAWDIAKESFWQGGLADVVNTFKLRASYGTVGNISGIGNFASFSFFSGSGLYQRNPTLTFSQAGNNLLSWETSKKTDIGFTFGLLNDRISGEFAWYNNDIDGLLLSVPNALSTGMPNSVLQNVGAMYNRGVEFTLNATPIMGKDFTWNTSFNITYNKNQVTRLAEGVDNIPTATQLETANITLPGYSIGMTYVVESRGVDPQTGRRVLVDENGRELLYDHSAPSGQRYTYRDNGQVAPNLNTALAQKVWKNTNPQYFGGFENTFKYKNFDLNILLTYQLGFYVYNGTRATTLDQRFWNSNKEVLNRWQKPGDVTDIPRLVYADNTSNGSAFPISDNVEKGDFLRLRNLSLGYNLPFEVASKLKISNARLYISGQNLFLATKYRGPDPEVSSNGTGNANQGVDRNTVGNARVLTVGLNVGF